MTFPLPGGNPRRTLRQKVMDLWRDPSEAIAPCRCQGEYIHAYADDMECIEGLVCVWCGCVRLLRKPLSLKQLEAR